jgi:predicted dehydrogenase
MVKVGIIGFGYWGPNLVRNFNAGSNCVVSVVADMREERLEVAKSLYPGIETSNSAEDIFDSTDVDAVVIATPVFTHFELAEKALQSGKHVLLEKPMTSTVEEAEKLMELADNTGKVLMVDHTFLYTGAVQKIKELIDNGTIGTVNYFDSTRINLGLFQPDINVLWDLAPHDISILSYLVSDTPYSIQSTGVSHTNNSIENIAYMTVNYQSGLIAHFNCSWSSPVKIRQILIGGDKKMILFNDMEPTEKVKIYDTGYDLKNDEDKRRVLVDYRTGDIYTPKVDRKEALAGVTADFINAINTGEAPVSNSESGLSVVRILEASQHSIKHMGQEVVL